MCIWERRLGSSPSPTSQAPAPLGKLPLLCMEPTLSLAPHLAAPLLCCATPIPTPNSQHSVHSTLQYMLMGTAPCVGATTASGSSSSKAVLHMRLFLFDPRQGGGWPSEWGVAVVQPFFLTPNIRALQLSLFCPAAANPCDKWNICNID